MNAFALALGAFVLLHIGVSATGMRAMLVARLGEGPYRIAFSLASIVLLGWLILAFGAVRADPFDLLAQPLWSPPDWLRWPAMMLVLLGFLLGVSGLLTPGPTLAGFEAKGLAQAEPARGVLRITRHPFLWGVALWAAGHLLANGERYSVMLFGALGLMAVFGARSIDRKGRARDPDAWARFEAVTSNAPFVAIAQGRNKIVPGEIGWRALAALAAFVLVALLHRQLIGVPAF
ncbi:NnrU family protein [Terricaulis sp.]|uniref:NnrU family protein n=1 Tax=Terricaulis sp. TaxID=2768686 RepID=UPI003784261C